MVAAVNVKQVIVIRRDLNMRRGKEIAQGAHASMAWLTRRLHRERLDHHVPSEPGHCCDVPVDALQERALYNKVDYFVMTDAEWAWVLGLFTKVVCQVASEAELRAVYDKAKAAGLTAHLIIDSGKTEFG